MPAMDGEGHTGTGRRVWARLVVFCMAENLDMAFGEASLNENASSGYPTDNARALACNEFYQEGIKFFGMLRA
jgi:hypothetical protein